MRVFTVYASTGQILNSGTCMDDDFDLQKGPNQSILEILTNPMTQYIQNGQVTEIPPQPSYASTFDYVSGQWVGDQANQETMVISRRNGLLYSSDWTQIPNNPLTPEKQQEWADYRQQLRDITQQPGYPFNVVWPTQPE